MTRQTWLPALSILPSFDGMQISSDTRIPLPSSEGYTPPFLNKKAYSCRFQLSFP
jgi:hypothetical protein